MRVYPHTPLYRLLNIEGKTDLLHSPIFFVDECSEQMFKTLIRKIKEKGMLSENDLWGDVE